MGIQQEFLQIIKCILNNDQSPLPVVSNIESFIPLARRHDLLAYLYVFIERFYLQGMVSENVTNYLESYYLQQIAQSVHQALALEEMQQAFETDHIYNMPLKGSCTKRLYPAENLRIMGDIDILFKAEQGKKIRNVMNSLEYDGFQEGRKHDIYRRNPCITVEAHRELVAVGSEFSSYYENIWDKCVPKKGYSYCYEMSVEDEFIFNIIHLIEHFKEGGAGIRFIMDVYVYDNLEIDRQYFEDELKRLGIFEFYQNASLLAKCWFGKDPMILGQDKKQLLDRLGSFILSNGSAEMMGNHSDLAVYKGRVPFILKTCFPSYQDMCSMFPWLRGIPLLLPYSWAIRGIRSLRNRPKNVGAQFQTFKNGNADRGKELVKFYSDCGL